MRLFGFGRENDDFPRGKKEKKEDDSTSMTTRDNSVEDTKDSGIRNIEDSSIDDTGDNENIGGNRDMHMYDNKPETNNDDDYIDYIDPDDLDYDDYGDLIDYIESDFTSVSSSGLYPISHLDTNIVITHPVMKGENGIVLEIVCPGNSIITICGFHQKDTDENFLRSPNLYTRPHFITLRCADENGKEISNRNIVSISKVDRNGVLERFYQEFYGDLSPLIDERLKKKHERYYFAETIILQGKERLIFQIKPNIDIFNVELLMMADLFNRDE